MDTIDLTIDQNLLQHIKEALRLSEGDFQLALVKNAGAPNDANWALTIVPSSVVESVLFANEAAYYRVENEKMLVNPQNSVSELAGKHMKWSSKNIELEPRA